MNARLSLIVGCLLAVGLGIWASLAPQNEAARGVSQPLAAVTLLPSGKALPEFSLVDKAGQSVGREAFLQRWSLVFLGFTHCGDICPLTMARMQLIQEAVNGAVE
ncbi:MAG: SCO family protein, partial [Gammaproteobacteria bacterium]